MVHGLKYITFCAKKYTASLAICYNLPLVRNKPLGAPAFVYSRDSVYLAVRRLTAKSREVSKSRD